ncbi:MFS general substrate transporter [Amylocystis lapponica]|nr:MFS general substrate transporter [Amylocystis lapponica]
MDDDAEGYQATDAIGSSNISVFSVSRVRSSHPVPADHSSVQIQPRIMDHTPEPGSERDPLLGPQTKLKKPFYRARPLWLVPFALFASIVRGMTLGPRVEIFTQLSCNAIYGHDVYDHTTIGADSIFSSINHIPLHIDPSGPHLSRLHFISQLPSKRCLQDAAVQAGAARLQTTMTFTMGVLSALTTGWWGHFGELHGRTKVLSAATLGLLLTDLIFILAAITAYVSDCTSDGSRAQMFSRFTGVSFFGLSIGPTIGAFLITHPLFNAAPASHAAHGGTHTVTSVFYLSAMCSLVNLLLALFVFPETPKKKAKIAEEVGAVTSTEGATSTGKPGFLAGFLAPFALLAPRKIENPGGASRKDWRLTFMALTLLIYALSTGIFQIKYLYAEHVYGWGAEQLSYYISAMGFARTIYLLVLMPIIIMLFKPKPDPATTANAVIPAGKKKAPPTPLQLAKEMRFDFMVLRASLLVDIISHTLVALSSEGTSAAMFTAYTSLSSFGAGVDPAMQSLALCIMQANGEDNRGKLFGAFAMLRTVGQMIVGPLLFGLIYSTTVATLPKAIFMTAAGFGVIALVLLFMVRTDVGLKTRRIARSRADIEIERGRSRVSKDIGHAVLNVSTGEGTSSATGLR